MNGKCDDSGNREIIYVLINVAVRNISTFWQELKERYSLTENLEQGISILRF